MKPLKLNIQFFAEDTSIGVDFRVNVGQAKKELQNLKKEVAANENSWKRFAVETENWEKSADGLQSGIEQLTKKQESQVKVVENLKKQYELVKANLGETDSWTLKLNSDYEKARLELAKTNAELKQYTDQQKEMNSGSVDASNKIEKLNEKIRILGNEIKKGDSVWEQYAAKTRDWGDTATGLQHKIDSLNDKQTNQKAILKKINEQYKLSKQYLGENSVETSKFAADVEDAKAKLAATKAELKDYATRLDKVKSGTKTADEEIKGLSEEVKALSNEVKKGDSVWEQYTLEAKDWESTADGLQKKVDTLTDKQKKQKEILEKLSKQYDICKDNLGENSVETSKLAAEVEDARTKLKKTGNELDDYDKKLNDAKNGTLDLDDASESLNGKFTVLKGTVSQLIADGIKRLASEAVEAAKQVVNVGISFESSFAGVRKTIDATEEEFAELRSDILDMSTEVASSADDIASVMEMAGQLGITNDALTDFTKTMIMLGDSTNMGAGEAAETLARFANITGMSQKDFEKLGSTLVDLGNNYATTEGEIMTMALRLAGAGEQVGMSETDILGLATALSSVGIEAEMGGTALSKAMSKAEVATALSGTKLKKVLDDTGISLHDLTIMQKNSSTDFNKLATSLDMTSTELGTLINAGNDLENFAEISGMTAEEFTKAWEKDAVGALGAFIQGLGDTSNASENAVTMLTEMGITEVRLRDSLIRAANASDLFNRAVGDSNAAWDKNTALVTEAERRYATVESQLAMTKNELVNAGIAIYDKFRGPLVDALDSARESIRKFGEQMESQEMTEAIEIIAEGIGKFVATLAELAVKVIPKVLTVLSKLIKNWDKIKPLVVGATTALVAYRVANSKLITGIAKSNALSKTAGILWDVLTKKTTLATAAQKLYNLAQAATPWGLLALGVGAVAAAMVVLSTDTNKAKGKSKEFTEELKKQKDATEEISKKIQEQKTAYEELEEAKEEAIDDGLAELSQTEKLRDELNQLVDANGKVTAGYETRVGFILNELNEALGTEFKLTNGIVENYKNAQKEIDNLIEKEKAYVIWEAQKPKYEEAIKNEAADRNNWVIAENNVKNAEKFLEDTKKKLQPAYKEFAKTVTDPDLVMKYVNIDETGKITRKEGFFENVGDMRTWRHVTEQLSDYARVVAEVSAAEKALKDAEKEREDATKSLADSIKTKTEYEVYSSLVLAGEYEKVIERYGKMIEATAEDDAKMLKEKSAGFAEYQKLLEEALEQAKKTNDEDAIESLEAQLKANEASLQNTMKYLHEQTSTVENTSPEIIAAWKDLAQNSTTEFLSYLNQLPPAEAQVIRDMVGTVDAEGENLVSSWSTLTARSLSQITGKNVEFIDAGNGLVQAVIDGKEVGEPQALDAMAQLGADLAQRVKDKKIDAETAGKELIAGVESGVSNNHKQQSILGKIGAFASSIVAKLKSAWDVHSPSRVSRSIAEMFMEGIGLGITKKETSLLNEMGNFANEMSSTLQSSLGNIRANVNGTVSLGADTSTLNEIGQIQPNGGKTVIINQTNNSPKALSRLEIWRQTNNAAQLAARN